MPLLTTLELDALRGLRVAGPDALATNMPGDRPSRRHGLGYEFAGHRAYQPGDRLQHVDWRRWIVGGRRRCDVRTYYAERAPRTCIVLDASASMETYPEDHKLETAAKTAFALVNRSLAADEPTEFVLLGGRRASDGWRHDVVRTPADLDGLDDRLESLQAGGSGLLEELARATVLPPGEFGTLALVSDLVTRDDVLNRALERLAARASRLHVVQIAGPRDFVPRTRSGNVRWLDVETGEQREFEFDVERHRQRFEGFLRDCETECRRADANRVLLRDCAAPWNATVDELVRCAVLEPVA